MKTMQRTLVMISAVCASMGAQAAITIDKQSAVIASIPGFSSFEATGASMAGMTVRAVFDGGLDQTLTWASTGASSGGVAGTGWGLSVDGDTFPNSSLGVIAAWNFTIDGAAQLGTLTTLVLSGKPGLTVFDTASIFGSDTPAVGTTGSALGLNFEFFKLSDDPSFCVDQSCDALVTYSDAVKLDSAADPLGDVFHTMTIEFLEVGTTGSYAGPRGDWSFRQDTDNDIRVDGGVVPEPGSLALVGLALAGLGLSKRRRAGV